MTEATEVVGTPRVFQQLREAATGEFCNGWRQLAGAFAETPCRLGRADDNGQVIPVDAAWSDLCAAVEGVLTYASWVTGDDEESRHWLALLDTCLRETAESLTQVIESADAEIDTLRSFFLEWLPRLNRLTGLCLRVTRGLNWDPAAVPTQQDLGILQLLGVEMARQVDRVGVDLEELGRQTPRAARSSAQLNRALRGRGRLEIRVRRDWLVMHEPLAELYRTALSGPSDVAALAWATEQAVRAAGVFAQSVYGSAGDWLDGVSSCLTENSGHGSFMVEHAMLCREQVSSRIATLLDLAAQFIAALHRDPADVLVLVTDLVNRARTRPVGAEPAPTMNDTRARDDVAELRCMGTSLNALREVLLALLPYWWPFQVLVNDMVPQITTMSEAADRAELMRYWSVVEEELGAGVELSGLIAPAAVDGLALVLSELAERIAMVMNPALEVTGQVLLTQRGDDAARAQVRAFTERIWGAGQELLEAIHAQSARFGSHDLVAAGDELSVCLLDFSKLIHGTRQVVPWMGSHRAR